VADAEGEEAPKPGALKKRDDLYEAAVDVVVREGRGSVSLLQRALGIGYGRGARLIDYMAEDGIVGQYNGSQAREVMISIAQWEAMQTGGDGAAEEAPPPAKSGGGGSKPSAKKSPPALPAPKKAAPEIPEPPKRRSNRILPEPDPEPEMEEEVEEELWDEDDDSQSAMDEDVVEDESDEYAEEEEVAEDESDEVEAEADDDLADPADDDDSIDAEARRLIKRFRAESA
jgi:S-DNA-T family DNA segregation ATPase FtsK/SpoIIIE